MSARGVGKKKEKGKTNMAVVDGPSLDMEMEMGSEYKPKEKENPPHGVKEGRSSSRGLSTRNDSTFTFKHNTPALPTRHASRSGFRNAGRGEEPTKVFKGKEQEEALTLSLRWSTSSLPSTNNNQNMFSSSSSSSIACTMSDLQRERERHGRSRKVSQKGMWAEEEGKMVMIPPPSPSLSPPPAPPIHPKKKKSQEKEDEVNVKGSEEVEAERNDGFPSKLHERLAFLERRVSQIASKLRRTKEMLDANKTHNSITMLSDIHLNISSIEKAMTADSFFGEDEEKEGLQIQIPSKSDDPAKTNTGFLEKEDAQGPSPTLKKRLNHQELEDRLFPHQKLLRNRPSLHLTVLKPKTEDIHEPSSFSSSHVQDVSEKGLPSPIDEDPIAAEFLIALNHTYSVLSDDNTPKLISTKSDEMRLGLALPNLDGNENEDSHIVSDYRDSIKDIGTDDNEPLLACDENMGFNDLENNQPRAFIMEEIEETPFDRLNQLGHKTSTAGWFVSEGESILLAHDDGSCSFHDIANSEEKSEYKVPLRRTPNTWGDCWLIRAAGSDGRSSKYVVAASAGTMLNSGFCSWDFYSKEIVAFHTEAEVFTCPSSIFSPVFTQRNLPGTNSCFANVVPENQHWWYRPCGPLMVATASGQKIVIVYDIRDGDHVMKWETEGNITNMKHSCPLQWRNKGKIVVAETQAISLWDVNSLAPRSLHYVAFPGRKVLALHVHNTDAECNGGVRQRVSSVEEGNDGVLCTQDAVNVFDFRAPSGVGLKIPMFGENVQSVFAHGDLIFAGVVAPRFSSKMAVQCKVHQWSIRGGKPVCVYTIPESNAHFEEFSVAQVWGSLNLVIAINGNGLFIFDGCNEDIVQCGADDHLRTKGVREVIGTDDLNCSSFDYSGSHILLVSKDRPAFWRYWS